MHGWVRAAFKNKQFDCRDIWIGARGGRVNKRVAKFLIIGSVGFGVDAGTVFVLTKFGISPIVARIPSLLIAIVVTWLLNRQHTFGLASRPRFSELMRYAAVAGVTAVLNFILYSLLLRAGMVPVLAIAVSTVCLMFVSFSGYRIFAFKMGQ